MVAGPGQGDTWQARDRDMDRHAMQSEVGYLFSGLWRRKGEGEKSREREKREKGREREERERQKGEEEKGERQKLPLPEGDRKGKELRLEAEDQPVSEDRGWGEWVWLVS